MQGKLWVEKLLVGDYDTLSTEERLEAALDLMHLALDMPSARAMLDKRTDDAERERRDLREETKHERRERLAAQGAQAKRDAEAAGERVARLRAELTAEYGLGMS